VNPTINRTKDDTSRTTVTGLKQQPTKPSGLAAAMNSTSKQETMMPGHRLREKAAGMYEQFSS
jgi:hypothetical protein